MPPILLTVPQAAAITVALVIFFALIVLGFYLVLSELGKQGQIANKRWRILMANTEDLNAAIAKLDQDVKALIAATPPATDLQPQVDAVNVIDAEVLAATPASPK